MFTSRGKPQTLKQTENGHSDRLLNVLLEFVSPFFQCLLIINHHLGNDYETKGKYHSSSIGSFPVV